MQFLIFFIIKKIFRQSRSTIVLLVHVKIVKTMGDIDPLKINNELERFVVIQKKNKQDLKTANDFLTYLCRKQVLAKYPNLYQALRVLLHAHSR